MKTATANHNAEPQGARGLTVKFDSRGRTYTQKDFRGMSDCDLLGKVMVFAVSLPWKDEENRKDLFQMLSISSSSIKEREKKKTQPQGEKEGADSAKSTQAPVKDREPQDPHFHCGICSPLPSTGNPCILRYREANLALGVIGDAFKDVPMSKRKRQRIDLAIVELLVALHEAQAKNGGEGLPLKLSRIWEGWTDQGTRKDENAPDPGPARAQDQGQGAKDKPSRGGNHTVNLDA